MPLKTGLNATMARPATNNMNIQGNNRLEDRGASRNSFHTKTPHRAETIVAPWPIAYEAAGPTRLTCDDTKLKTAPVHQIAPPSVAHKCQRKGALRYVENETDFEAVRGLCISQIFIGMEQTATPIAKKNATEYGPSE